MALTNEQEEFCHKFIHSSALLAGGGNLIPIPGVGFGADLGAMISMGIGLNEYFKEQIEKSVNKTLSNLETAQTICFGISAASFLIGTNIAESVIKDLAIQVIKETASKSVAKELIKFVPIIGQLVAPTLSIAMIEAAGWSLANTLHKKIFEEVRHNIKKMENLPPDVKQEAMDNIEKNFGR